MKVWILVGIYTLLWFQRKFLLCNSALWVEWVEIYWSKLVWIFEFFFLKFVANAVQSTFSMMHTRKSHYLPALKLNTKEGTKMDVFEIECKKGYKKGCTFLICTSKMQSSPRSIFFFFAIVFSSFNNQDYYNWKLSISINIKLFLKLFGSK